MHFFFYHQYFVTFSIECAELQSCACVQANYAVLFSLTFVCALSFFFFFFLFENERSRESCQGGEG